MPMEIYNITGLAFRGHKNEEVQSIDLEQSYYRSEANEGHFIGLVKLMAGENQILTKHIKNCQNNAKAGHRGQTTFLSNSFINSTLYDIRKYLVKSIVDEIHRNGGCFGLLMDGTQDISSKEQISVVVRYISDSNDVVEHTISIFNAKDTSGKAIYESMRTILTENGLSLSKVVGCSFDGAWNMRSEACGVNFYLHEDNVNCIYTWCFSHRFNLAVKEATNGSEQVKSILKIAEDSAKLFRSSHIKMNVWIEVATTTSNYNSLKRLKLIGTTRWSSKQDAIADIIFAAIVPTTKFLQKSNLNIVDGMQSLKESYQRLETSKDNQNNYIKDAEDFIIGTNNFICTDREIQCLDCDCSIRLPIESERVEIVDRTLSEFHNFIQNMQKEINSRILAQFNETENIYHEMKILDPLYTETDLLPDHESASHAIKKLCEINKIDKEVAMEELKQFTFEFLNYQERSQYVSVLNNNDFDKDNVSDSDDEQINLVIEDVGDLEETAANMENVKLHPIQKKSCYCFECILKYIGANEVVKKKFDNVYRLYKYISMLPSTQVKCERDFSKLKLTKNRLRSNLTEQSLENLILISTESNMFKNLDVEDIIDYIIDKSSKLSTVHELIS